MTIETGFLLLIKSSGLGQGEADLGQRLTRSFFKVMSELGRSPARIIFVNSGVFLSTEGSSIIDVLKNLEKLGTEILSCATSLEYYGRTDKLKVGKPAGMQDTVDAILDFRKVVTI
jgi:selenium metabolism protein YedF